MPSVLERLRQETYPGIRKRVLETILGASGKGFEDTKESLHTGGNYDLTKRVANAPLVRQLPNRARAAIGSTFSDAAYGGNELLTGALATATGRPFFSEYGYNVGDLFRNKKGQDRATREILAEGAKAAERAKMLRGFSMPYGK